MQCEYSIFGLWFVRVIEFIIHLIQFIFAYLEL